MEILASQIVQTPSPQLLLESLNYLADDPSNYLKLFMEIIFNASKRPNLQETVLVLLKYILSTKVSDKKEAEIALKTSLQILMNIDKESKLRVLGNCYGKILGLFYDLEMPSRYWNYLTCFKVEIDQDFNSTNMAKRNNALLFLSSLVVHQLKLKRSHLYLSQDHLIQEAKQILNRYMTFFATLDQNPTSMEVICATMNSFFTIIKECDEYALACTKLLVNIKEMSLSYLSPFQKRSVYRNLKVILLSCYSLPATQELDDEIEQILLGFDVHPRELQNKQKIKRMKGREEKVVEMQVPLPPTIDVVKKTEVLPHYDGPVQDQSVLTELILTRGISSFNHHHLTEIILETISDRDEMLFQKDLERFLEVEGVYDAAYRAPPNPADDEVMLMDIDIDAILEGVDDLDEDERRIGVEGCISRILEMDEFFSASLKVKEVGGGAELGRDTLISARFGWMVIVSRMMSKDLGFPKKEVVKFALEDFHKRVDLVVFWLFEEFVKGKEYDQWLKLVLEEMKEKLDPKDRIFTRFLVEIPDLPQFGLDYLYAYCKDETRMPLGLATLRDLCIYRPAVRQQCLKWLFEFSTCLNGQARANACAALKRFASGHETISPLVVDYATESFKSLISLIPSKDENGEVTADQQELVMSKLELYLVLSTIKPELLKGLFESVKDLDSYVFEVLSATITPFFSQHPAESLLELISDFPEGSESLVLNMIMTLLKNEEIKADVIEKTRVTVIEKNLDVRFLNLIITFLDRDNVLKHLSKIVESLDSGDEGETVKETFMTLTEIKPSLGDEAPEPTVTPAELLIKIHNLEGICSLKSILAGKYSELTIAVKICFEMPEVFTQEVLATVLSKLSDQIKLPTLFMRSVLDCLRLFPTLSKFINGLLARLVGKQVWKRPKLWEGFSIAITRNFPSSLSVILQLPRTRAVDLLKNKSDLKDMLRDYLQDIPAHQQGRREVLQLGNLLDLARD